MQTYSSLLICWLKVLSVSCFSVFYILMNIMSECCIFLVHLITLRNALVTSNERKSKSLAVVVWWSFGHTCKRVTWACIHVYTCPTCLNYDSWVRDAKCQGRVHSFTWLSLTNLKPSFNLLLPNEASYIKYVLSYCRG